MSSELTVVQPPSIQQGGMGIDFNSKFFKTKPATLVINQPNTQVEGALKGHLRVNETGDQYKEMFVTLLMMPVEKRAYYIGEAGQLNRSQENLMCFCRNVNRNPRGFETQGPDSEAKMPQSLSCSNCRQSSWDKWRQTKKKEDLPGCDLYYYVLLLDTEFKIPLQMFIRSKSKGPFEAGMENVKRLALKMKSQGLNPNIFDIGFKLSTKQITTNKASSYVLHMSDVQAISPEHREEFGGIYEQFASRYSQGSDEGVSDTQQINQTDQAIDAAVVPPTGNVVQGEITI